MPYLILKIDPSVQLSNTWLTALEATDSTFATVYNQLAIDSNQRDDGRLPTTKSTDIRYSPQFRRIEEQQILDFTKKHNLSISFLFSGSSPKEIADFQRYHKLNTPDGVNFLNYFRLSNAEGEIPAEDERHALTDLPGVKGGALLEAHPDDEKVPLVSPHSVEGSLKKPALSLFTWLVRFIVSVVRFIVRIFSIMFTSGPAVIPPPPIESCQDYMRELCINQAWSRNGMGQNVRLCIIDHQWIPKINPLYTVPSANYPNQQKSGAVDHGTNTLGVLIPRFSLVAQQYIGLVPNTDVYLSTVDDKVTKRQDNRSALLNAITNASGPVVTDKTGVILTQIGGGVSGSLPLETDTTIFDLMHTATRASVGITVVETAGNGTNTLPRPTDSGAIVVGATSYLTSAASHRYTQRTNTNTGAIVDVRVWGDRIRTVNGVENGSPVDFNAFGMTSAAATIVAGIVCSLQSIARAQYNKVIPPDVVRTWFRAVNQVDAAATYKMPLMGDLLVKLDAYCSTH